MKKKLLFIMIFIFLIISIFYILYNNKNNNKNIKNKDEFQIYSESTKLKKIYLYVGNIKDDGFKIIEDNIYENEYLINEIKQVIQKLLEIKDKSDYYRTIPEGTLLRECFLDRNNICYLDFTEEIKLNHKGGTQSEFLTIYSIVNTIFYNFKNIKGVKILINGKEEETLNGHLDISEILLPAN